MDHPLETARAALSNRLSFADFLLKLPPRDRANAERRITVLEAEGQGARAQLWSRLACSLMTLAPFSAKLIGKQTLQLYVADGKFRMQVFALEDLQDGNFSVYCPDIVDEAVKLGVLSAPQNKAQPESYVIEPSLEPLNIKQLNSKSLNPAPHYKDMTGWNRKAIRITLSSTATPVQIETTEVLCAMAEQNFVKSALPFVARGAKPQA